MRLKRKACMGAHELAIAQDGELIATRHKKQRRQRPSIHRLPLVMCTDTGFPRDPSRVVKSALLAGAPALCLE